MNAPFSLPSIPSPAAELEARKAADRLFWAQVIAEMNLKPGPSGPINHDRGWCDQYNLGTGRNW